MLIDRRHFLTASALGVGGMVLHSKPGWAAEERSVSRLGVHDAVTLGRTSIKTSRVSLGTGVRGGMRQSNMTRMGTETAQRLIRDMYERGVRCFDLADLYGTHAVFQGALEGVPRDQIAIFTKIWFRPGGIPEADRPDADVVVQRFLKELKTDYIDMVLLHCVESAQWPKELARQMEILAELKRKGLIRAHGVSCHSLPALEAVVDEPWVDSVHARINPYQIQMDGTPDQIAGVLRRIRAKGEGVVGMKIIGEGRLRNDEEKKERSIQFAWEQGLVDLVTVGFEKTDEVEDFDRRLGRARVTATRV